MSAQETREPVRGQSLADGAAGTTLLHLEFGNDCRDLLKAMVAEPVEAHPDEATLFEGAPAVAFTLSATSHWRALTTLDEHVDTVTRTRLAAAHRRIDRGVPPAKREFDLIAGLTGLGAYLLHRHRGGDLLRDVLAYLVRLTEPQPDGLPGWWAADAPGRQSPDWQGGHGNLGIAHGIAGPLALLSIAMRRGITVDGQAEAMNRICQWLDRWRCGTAHRAWWPGVISRSEHEAGVVRQHGPQRPSWCYGTPGLARAQHIAGIALNDASRQHFAQQVLAWCVADESQLAQLRDVSLCHGWAGLVHTAWRVGQDDEQVRAHIPRLLDRLAESLRHQPPSSHGLLEGEPGVRLAQHAATTNTPPATGWDACLLLDS
ncbi:lanthionine synthetase C family protein [Saccharopolyspora taberi]|uniref:Lanthionine synthetase n=1 Tax=Saccharopolyspora taberi TaxID=60895 RepID=A0ABN3VJX9_9PSEU